MKSDLAAQLYRGTEQYNCTQAVLKAFQNEGAVSDEVIAAAANLGGGKADQGICGALYAALTLVGDGPDAERIKAEFAQKTGSIRCQDIRKSETLTCRDYVRLAAELLEPQLVAAAE